MFLLIVISGVRNYQFRRARDRAVRCARNLFCIDGAGLIYTEIARTNSVEDMAHVPTVEELLTLLPQEVRDVDSLCPEGHHYVVTLATDSNYRLLISCPVPAHNDPWLGPDLWTESTEDQREPIEKRLRSRLQLFPSSIADFLVLALVVITIGLGCWLPDQRARKIVDGRYEPPRADS